MDFHYATQQGCTGAWIWPCMGFTWERAQELITRYQNAISWCTETQPTASFLLFSFCILIGSVFVVVQPFYLRNLDFVHFKGKQKNNMQVFTCWFNTTINSMSAILRSDRGAVMKTRPWFHCGSKEDIYGANTIWIWTHIKQSWCHLLQRLFLPQLLTYDFLCDIAQKYCTHISSLYLQVSKWSCWFRQIINLCLLVKQACSGAVPSFTLTAGSQITVPVTVVWKISQTTWYLFRFMNSHWQKSTATVVKMNHLMMSLFKHKRRKRNMQVLAEAENKVNSQGRHARCVTLAWFQPSLAQCTHLFYCTLHSTITWLSCCCIRVSKLNSLSRLKPSVTVSFYVCLGCLPCGLKEVQARRAWHECHQLLFTEEWRGIQFL